jgi:hypothetical protein
MNFIEAVQQMKKGNHVRLPDWEESKFFCINSGMIYSSCWCGIEHAYEDPYVLDETEFLSNDWEVVE